MNPGYNRVYAPVLRSPLLFHQTPLHSAPTYNPTQPSFVPSNPTINFPRSPQYTLQLQPQYTVQAPLPLYPHSFPYRPGFSTPSVPTQMSFSSYSIPNLTYASTVSSKGLALILIAILILAALDLVIVRPQKRNALLEQ
ncbi:MAG: hypothetical protein Q8911_07985 [Bacillota bacterium]|nr:hypothetical protein [Bacillota bacterium]